MDETAQEHMPDEARLRDLLLGRRVVEARISTVGPEQWTSGPTGFLTLDDGTVLKVWGNEGGCSCSSGDYPLSALAAVDNAITNVEVEARPDGEDEECPTCGQTYGCGHPQPERGFYRVFVFADARFLLASFDGTDGNGYYGTGWWLSVESAPDAEVAPS